MSEVNYLKVSAWVHCLHCHKNIHKDDTIQHFYKTCEFKDIPTDLVNACLCLMPDVDFVPEKETLTWQ